MSGFAHGESASSAVRPLLMAVCRTPLCGTLRDVWCALAKSMLLLLQLGEGMVYGRLFFPVREGEEEGGVLVSLRP